MKHLEILTEIFDSFLSSCDFHRSVEDSFLLGRDAVLLAE
jgi:hypothetical protein